MSLCLAVLQNAWDPDWERYPLFFDINPGNASGRRLYYTVGSHDLRVTNLSSEVGNHANDHRLKPDLPRLQRCFQAAPWDYVLLCGRWVNRHVSVDMVPCAVIKMPHPASRSLPNWWLDMARKHIDAGCKDTLDILDWK